MVRKLMNAVVVLLFLQLAITRYANGKKVHYQLALHMCDESHSGTNDALQVHVYDKKGNACSSPIINQGNVELEKGSMYKTDWECDSDEGGIPLPNCKGKCYLDHIKISRDGCKGCSYYDGLAPAVCFKKLVIQDWTRQGFAFHMTYPRGEWLNEEDKLYTFKQKNYPWTRGMRTASFIVPGVSSKASEEEAIKKKWGLGCIGGPGLNTGKFAKC